MLQLKTMKNTLSIIVTFTISLVLGCGSDDELIIPAIGVRAHSSVLIGEDMYAFGGGTAGDFVNFLWKTNISTPTNTWDLLTPDPAPEARAHHAAFVAVDPNDNLTKMYIIGGWNRTGIDTRKFFGDMWAYTPDGGNGSWSEIETYIGPALAGHSAVYYDTNDKIYIFGGDDGSKHVNDLWECELVSSTCTLLSPVGPPPGRVYHTAIVSGSTMYIYGGQAGSTNLNDLWAFTLPRGPWQQISGISANPPSLSFHTAIGERANMYVFGGSGTTSSAVWRYDPPSINYTLDTIAFVDGGIGNDLITDSNNGFISAGFEIGDVIIVSGSASNDGMYTILSVASNTIEVATNSLTNENAGNTVSIITADYVSNNIAFVGYNDSGINDEITDSSFPAGFSPGDVIVVSGSTNNDGTYTITSTAIGIIRVSPESLTTENVGNTIKIISSGRESNTIAFVGYNDSGINDEITDSNFPAGFGPGDVIVVSGSTNNSGTYTIISATGGTIEIAPQSLTTENAGPLITITENYWAARPIPSPSPAHRLSHSAVFNGTMMYVLGGFPGSLNVSFGDLWEYNVSTNTWQQMSSLPVP